MFSFGAYFTNLARGSRSSETFYEKQSINTVFYCIPWTIKSKTTSYHHPAMIRVNLTITLLSPLPQV